MQYMEKYWEENKEFLKERKTRYRDTNTQKESMIQKEITIHTTKYKKFIKKLINNQIIVEISS